MVVVDVLAGDSDVDDVVLTVTEAGLSRKLKLTERLEKPSL